MSNDFDLNKVFSTVRSTINPEYAVPKEKELHPVNFRADRIRKLVGEITAKQAALAEDLAKLNTSLNALLEDVQPYLEEEVKVAEEEAKKAAEEDAAKAEEAKAEDKTEEDKPAEESSEEDKK